MLLDSFTFPFKETLPPKRESTIPDFLAEGTAGLHLTNLYLMGTETKSAGNGGPVTVTL